MSTLAEQITCLRGEVAKRKAFYPSMIAKRRMTELRASVEIERMSDALGTLLKVEELQKISREMVDKLQTMNPRHD